MKDKVESRLLLDVVIRQGTAVFKLLSSKDQTLLVRWDDFFVLNLASDLVDGIRGLDFEGDGFAGEGLDEDLRPPTKMKDKVESRLL